MRTLAYGCKRPHVHKHAHEHARATTAVTHTGMMQCRGSRVESYDDIQKLALRLMQPWAWWVGGSRAAPAALPADSSANKAGSTAAAGSGAAAAGITGLAASSAGIGPQDCNGGAGLGGGGQAQPQSALGGSVVGHAGGEGAQKKSKKKRKRSGEQAEEEEKGGVGGPGRETKELGAGSEPFLRMSLPQQVCVVRGRVCQAYVRA